MKTRLTDIAIQKLAPGVYMDERTPAFGIRVGKNRRAWIIVQGKGRVKTTIGQYPALSLAEARAEARRLLSTTSEPRSTSITFLAARDEFLGDNYRHSRSRWKHIVTLIFKRHFRKLDHLKLADITDSDIRGILDGLSATPSAQLHAYRVVRAFLNWCTRPPRRYLRFSPMQGYEPPGKDRKGSRILTDEELKAVWNVSSSGSRLVFRLLILWGTRNAETTCLERTWAKDDVITIPGEHTKNGRDHSIPLLPLAQSVLNERPEFGPYFFPGRYSTTDHLTAGALNQLRRDIQKESGTKDWQARDLRRTFRSNMARLGVPREICEVLINHAPPVLDEIYDRYDRLDEKRQALARYEAFMVRLLAQG